MKSKGWAEYASSSRWMTVEQWRYGIFSYRDEAATNIVVWRLIARLRYSKASASYSGHLHG